MPRVGYRYYDPYCDLSFPNLDIYLDHTYDYDHLPIANVIDRYGYVVASCDYRDGAWVVTESY